MDLIATIAFVLIVLGIIGDVIPVLPGPAFTGGAFLCLYFSDSLTSPISLTSLIVWLLATVLVSILDYVFPAYVTKTFGGHRAASICATIGLFIGLFFTPVGMVIGSFLGAFIGEYFVTRSDFPDSLKAAIGAYVSFILTTGIKLVFSLVILGVMVSHL